MSKTIYLDEEFRCHVTNETGTYKEVETDIFDGMCNAYIEGYRYIPAGETWTREDGVSFMGEMVAPCKDHNILTAAQSLYEEMQAASAQADTDAMLVDLDYRMTLMELGITE